MTTRDVSPRTYAALTEDGWSIDDRHWLWLYDVLAAAGPCRYLEIGTHRGFSAAAATEAMADNPDLTATFCDLNVTPTLAGLAAAHGRRAAVFRGTGVEALRDGRPDFVFADGDHRYAAVKAETDLLLRRVRPRVIASHDTAGDPAKYGYDGPAYLKYAVQSDPAYMTVEDGHVPRDGEKTDRGMFFATTCLAMFRVIKESYARRCGKQGWEPAQINLGKP